MTDFLNLPTEETQLRTAKALESANESNRIIEKFAEEAKMKADEALEKSDNTRKQLDQVVIEGDSSVEASQARVDSKGHSYVTLKERLDEENDEVTAQISKINEIRESQMPHLMEVDGEKLKYGLKQENGFMKIIYEEA